MRMMKYHTPLPQAHNFQAGYHAVYIYCLITILPDRARSRVSSILDIAFAAAKMLSRLQPCLAARLPAAFPGCGMQQAGSLMTCGSSGAPVRAAAAKSAPPAASEGGVSLMYAFSLVLKVFHL
jgi:hypothetical protein